MDRWQVVEQSSVAKSGGLEREDRVVVVEHPDGGSSGVLVGGVVDGASAKTGRTHDGRTGGVLAAEALAAAFERLGEVPGRGAPGHPRTALDPAGGGDAVAIGVAAAVRAVAVLRERLGVDPSDLVGPSAVAACVLPHHGVLWRVGDVHVAIRRPGGWDVHTADKPLDRIAAAARAALLRCRLLQGDSVNELLADDPGRAMLMPLLRVQNTLANLDADTSGLAFGVLDGRPVPARLVETFPLPGDVLEVVIASDGYLSAAPTLADAEAELRASVAVDPLRIGEHASTKGVRPGADGFDDRSYLRLARSSGWRTPAPAPGSASAVERRAR